MKKVMNSAIVYFILAMISGVFYREFTKWWDFSGATTLNVLHTHLLILGTGVALLLSFVFKKQQPKHFNRLFFGYEVFPNDFNPFTSRNCSSNGSPSFRSFKRIFIWGSGS